MPVNNPRNNSMECNFARPARLSLRMREAALFANRLLDSRHLLTWALVIALALMTGFNLVQAHVIEVQRAEVRKSVATDFLYLNLLTRERKAAAAAADAHNKKAEPPAPPQSH